METIKNYRLKDFLTKDRELIAEYMNVLQFTAPVFTKKKVFHLKLKQVEFIKQNLNSNDDKAIIKIISIVQKCKKKEILKMPIVKFFGLYNSVKEQIEKISNAEQNSLTTEITNIKWEAVNGSERMQKYAIYNTLDALAEGDILKYNKIMNLPYSEVFTKLLMEKEKKALQDEMNAIKTT